MSLKQKNHNYYYHNNNSDSISKCEMYTPNNSIMKHEMCNKKYNDDNDVKKNDVKKNDVTNEMCNTNDNHDTNENSIKTSFKNLEINS
jgi:hypothetical protein